MASAQGPCRFGQYVTLHRQILDREGFPDVPILAPSSYMGYAGLDEPIRRQIFKAMLVGRHPDEGRVQGPARTRLEEGETNYRLEQEMAHLASVVRSGRRSREGGWRIGRPHRLGPGDERPEKTAGGHRRRGLRPQQRVRERARRALDREAGRRGVDGAAGRVGALHLVDVEPAPEPRSEVLDAARPGLGASGSGCATGSGSSTARPARCSTTGTSPTWTTCWRRR